MKKYIMVQNPLVKWVLAQAHEHASTVVMTVRCMEAWNKRNPLTEHYFEETTRPLTCLNLFYHAFQSRNWKVENEKQKIEMENGCPPSASVHYPGKSGFCLSVSL